MLTQCWHARAWGPHEEFVVHMVGFAVQAVDAGGIYSRTTACPARIMHIIPGSSNVDHAIYDYAGEPVWSRSFFGFEADGKVRVKQTFKNGLDVVLEEVGPVRPMSEPEFVVFQKRFRL